MQKGDNLFGKSIATLVFLMVSSLLVVSGYSYFFTEPKVPAQNQSVQENESTQGKPEEKATPAEKEPDKIDKSDEKERRNQEKPSIKADNSETDYSKLYPNLYVKRPEKQIIPQKTIFLTFDDGPSARTSEVLDILKENNIKATFFVVGNGTAQGKALMKRIVDEGHTIAPHTFTHNFKKIYASVESYLEDFNNVYNLIYETTGQKPGIFRFAGGSKNGFNKNNYRAIIKEMTRRGFDYYDWNLSTGDAARKGLIPAAECISNVLNYSSRYNNAVVLMHDAAAKTTTVEALPRLISGLKAQGFKFDKLSHNIYPVPYSLTKPYV